MNNVNNFSRKKRRRKKEGFHVPRLLYKWECLRRNCLVYLFSLANTSCTCNHDNCFRFSNKTNKNLFRFRLPLAKNKLHSSYISFISWNKKDEKLSLWNFSSCLLCKLAFCSWDICVLVYKWKFNPLTIHFCEFWFFTQEFVTCITIRL